MTIITHGLLRRRTLFVSDLDGTLLDSTSHVSPESAAMLNEAMAAGALFTVATARTPATVVSLLADVELRLPAVVMTGAALFDLRARTFSRLQYMAPGITPRMLDVYRRHKVSTFVYTFTGKMLEVYHIGPLNDLERGFISQRAHTGLKRFIISPSGESPLPRDLDNTLLLYSVQPWENARKVYEEIVPMRLPVSPLCYHDTFGPEWAQLEMFSATANKAKAVEAVASMTGADRIVAFGDNINDIPLFQLADEGIAVANAVPELKNLASDVIGENDAHSVAAHILSRTKRGFQQ